MIRPARGPSRKVAPYINADGATGGGGQYFEGLAQEVWEYPVGGYVPSQKWLQDRRGGQLTYDELLHYARMVGAFTETPLVLEEIENALGDWTLNS
jgi:hypothetical protein